MVERDGDSAKRCIGTSVMVIGVGEIITVLLVLIDDATVLYIALSRTNLYHLSSISCNK